MLLCRSRSRASRRNEHGGAVLESGRTGHGAGHSRVVGQACVAVAWWQKCLLTAVVLRLGLSLRRLRLSRGLSLALGLGRLGGRQAGGWRRRGGVIPWELGDVT